MVLNLNVIRVFPEILEGFSQVVERWNVVERRRFHSMKHLGKDSVADGDL